MAATSAPVRSAPANESCSSRSEAMHAPEQLVRALRFLDERRERRDVRIPFDERRHRTEPRERGGIQLPDFRADARSVVVDEHVAIASMAREMDLLNGRRRQSRDESLR